MSDLPATGGALAFEVNGQQYTSTLIDAMTGIDILARLLALIGEPLAGLLEGVLRDPAKVAKLIAIATTKGDTTKVEELLPGVSLSALGPALRAGLSTVKAAPLIRDLLSTTYRNGKPLRDDGEFNAAYRGNYVELFGAVWQVIKINKFFPLPGT